MASIFKKLGLNFSIDQTLSREGEDSELSLADDTDEFAESFSGKLDIADSEDENGSGRNSLKRGCLNLQSLFYWITYIHPSMRHSSTRRKCAIC